MKKFGLILIAFLLVNFAWMGFVRESLPPVPEIAEALSPKMNMNFSVNTLNYSGVEMALNERGGKKSMYVQFRMSNAWKTGRTGLVLTGIKTNSNFKNGMSPKKYLSDPRRKAQKKKDFSNFMKDSQGKSLYSYNLGHTLIKGKNGQTFMQMSYDGPRMEMLQMLEIPRPVTIPAPVSRKFVKKGILQFQPGNVRFDTRSNSFFIPVIIR